MRTNCSKRGFHTLRAPLHLPPLQKLTLGAQRQLRVTTPYLFTRNRSLKEARQSPAKAEMKSVCIP